MLNIDRSSQERPSSVGSLWEKILQIKSDEIFLKCMFKNSTCVWWRDETVTLTHRGVCFTVIYAMTFGIVFYFFRHFISRNEVEGICNNTAMICQHTLVKTRLCHL